MTVEELLARITLVVVVGTLAQWLAWRFRFPSILLLLGLGLIAGPAGLHLIDPDQDLGNLLFPFVSLSVALILFEGGLSLRFSEIPGVKTIIVALLTIGMLVTWLVGSWGAWVLLGFDLPLAVLFGAIITVSGPTVVLPLIRHVRPKAPLGEILKWEGILIDPIGALLAVLMFEAILAGEFHQISSVLGYGVLKTVFVGGGLGLCGAFFAALMLQRHYVPDFLENMFSLALVFLVHVTSNHFHPESGLFAVTIMGIILANVKTISVRHILDFNETLRILLISFLFILLAARVTPSDLESIDLINSLAFLALLVFVARPAAAILATIGSNLRWNERLFLSWVAPRGIVAAAVSSLFALKLISSGYPGAETLAPNTFLVIVGTVLLYSLTAKPVAKLLSVQQENPNGILIVGANKFGRMLGKALFDLEIPVLLVDSNHKNIMAARLDGLRGVAGNILSEKIVRSLNLEGIGKFIALTSNHEANSLACLRFAEIFERPNVFQLAEAPTRQSQDKAKGQARHLLGRTLFDEKKHFDSLEKWCLLGAKVKATLLTEEFTYEDFSRKHADLFLPLFLISEDKTVSAFVSDVALNPKPGQKIVTLVNDEDIEIKKEVLALLESDKRE